MFCLQNPSMSKRCLACFHGAGAEKVNGCFLTVSVIGWPLADQMIPTKLTDRQILVLCMGQWLISFCGLLCDYLSVPNECGK